MHTCVHLRISMSECPSLLLKTWLMMKKENKRSNLSKEAFSEELSVAWAMFFLLSSGVTIETKMSSSIMNAIVSKFLKNLKRTSNKITALSLTTGIFLSRSLADRFQNYV